MSSQTRKNGRRAKLTTKYCLRFPFCWANRWVISISYDSGLPHLTVGLWFNLYGGRADFRRGSGIALYHFFSYDIGCRWVPATPAIWRSHVHSCPHAQKFANMESFHGTRKKTPTWSRAPKPDLAWRVRARRSVRQHGEFPWNQKENTYLVPGAETRWPSDVGWLDQEITGIQLQWRVMSQTTPGSENNPHLVDMPLENAKRPTKVWAERCSPSEPQARLATPSSSQTVLLDELGSIEAHLQPSYRTAIVSVDFLEEV
ncbi:hypothetical protein B0H14DRAFT_2615187 [Mycena olivaceomarginata]|nr:hypothetical protein B0H14DRAFT_2615187 [Mycena olivaceomarginata]